MRDKYLFFSIWYKDDNLAHDEAQRYLNKNSIAYKNTHIQLGNIDEPQ